MIFFNIWTFLYAKLFIDFHNNAEFLKGTSKPYSTEIHPMLRPIWRPVPWRHTWAAPSSLRGLRGCEHSPSTPVPPVHVELGPRHGFLGACSSPWTTVWLRGLSEQDSWAAELCLYPETSGFVVPIKNTAKVAEIVKPFTTDVRASAKGKKNKQKSRYLRASDAIFHPTAQTASHGSRVSNPLSPPTLDHQTIKNQCLWLVLPSPEASRRWGKPWFPPPPEECTDPASPAWVNPSLREPGSSKAASPSPTDPAKAWLYFFHRFNEDTISPYKLYLS